MSDDDPLISPARKYLRLASWCAGIALLIIPLNVVVWFSSASSREWEDPLFAVFSVLALIQLKLGIIALVMGIKARRRIGTGTGWAVTGALAAFGAPVGWFLGLLGYALGSMGGAWGRPLRVGGRQLHPNLRVGSDWTRGDRPSAEGLDPHTRRALEALWLHDAQKEHASVPAFSRIAWLLAGLGAPAELLGWSHRAAIEEIDHAERCFALAAGYGGRSHTVEPMPELLPGMHIAGDPLITLAVESLQDGCQLEDFNADVAAACAEVCEEPTTRSVLQQIAREERSHAELSWALLEWAYAKAPGRVGPAIRDALRTLDAYPRPTAVSSEKRALVDRADARRLRAHGRLPDAEWAAAWADRLARTHRRCRTLLRAEGLEAA